MEEDNKITATLQQITKGDKGDKGDKGEPGEDFFDKYNESFDDIGMSPAKPSFLCLCKL